MTLNITSVSDALVVQVADRRMVSADWRFVDDARNKAILLSCQDGQLAITFAGWGVVNNVRMDTHVAGRLQDHGIAELGIENAVPAIAAAGEEMLASIPSQQRHHAFTVAGFGRAAGGQLEPKLWILKNYSGVMPDREQPADNRLAVKELPTPTAIATGLVNAITAEEKLKLESAAEKLNNASAPVDLAAIADGLESAMVDAIRGAAANSQGIGRNCMALSLTPRGEARATSYIEGEAVRSLAPIFVWYAGGRNICLADIEALVGSGYDIEIGGNDGPFRLGFGLNRSPKRRELPPGDFDFRCQVRFTPAVHHPDAVVENVQLAHIPSDED